MGSIDQQNWDPYELLAIIWSFCTLDLQRECYGYNTILSDLAWYFIQDFVVDSFYIVVCKLGEFHGMITFLEMLPNVAWYFIYRYQDYVVANFYIEVCKLGEFHDMITFLEQR